MSDRMKLAGLGLDRAADWLMGAKRALEDCRWSDVVYASQMAVEQSVKAVLLALGIDYPKEHDVSDALLKVAREMALPGWFKRAAPTIADTVAELAEQRGLAGYGFEEGVGRDYFESYAPDALRRAREAHEHCRRLLSELQRKPRLR